MIRACSSCILPILRLKDASKAIQWAARLSSVAFCFRFFFLFDGPAATPRIFWRWCSGGSLPKEIISVCQFDLPLNPVSSGYQLT